MVCEVFVIELEANSFKDDNSKCFCYKFLRFHLLIQKQGQCSILVYWFTFKMIYSKSAFKKETFVTNFH